MATKLIDLIEDITQDDLPTNIFTIEDEDPMVILGKLNEVIAWLKELDIDNVEDILELIASKVAKTSQANRVYGTDNTGEQKLYEIGLGDKRIPVYDANVRLQANSPVNDIDVANKKYVDDADALKQNALTETQLDAVNSGIDSTKVGQIATNTSNIANKVDKTSLYNRIYGTNASGVQMLKQVKSANEVDDLNFEFGENYDKIPDITQLAYWDGGIDASKASNLKYCNGGEIASKSYVDTSANNLQNQINTSLRATNNTAVSSLNFTPTQSTNRIYAYGPDTTGKPPIAPYGIVLTLCPANTIFGSQTWAKQIAYGNYYSSGLIAMRNWNTGTNEWEEWQITQ